MIINGIKYEEDWNLFNQGTRFLNDRGFDQWGQPLDQKKVIGSSYNSKKELSEACWSGKVDLDWITNNNEQGITFVKTENIKKMVFEKIKTQVKLFMNSAGTSLASKEDITEQEAISFNLWIYEDQSMTTIAEILGVTRQTINNYLDSFFTKIGLVLDIGIALKNQLLEKFMTPAVLELRKAVKKKKDWSRDHRKTLINHFGAQRTTMKTRNMITKNVEGHWLMSVSSSARTLPLTKEYLENALNSLPWKWTNQTGDQVDHPNDPRKKDLSKPRSSWFDIMSIAPRGEGYHQANFGAVELGALDRG
ncbi:hypothetical protein [Bacillus sp. AFS031507]|uniref:hypothetical protein n=1 Tax=Bacillus sp. AFS031507 TaxID=2033496 RepID=UPI000BFB1A2A|nr:hypothetical protein [Bacillus sp. AFS031507]PGY13193.1 hypothetical protein COE25_08535 [Bacillus sp. AFS031507]